MEIKLPPHFKSWYHLWKGIEKKGYANEYKVIFQTSIDMHIEKKELLVGDIKEMLLKELLADKGKVQEFTFENLVQIQRALSSTEFRAQIYSEDGLLQKVKDNINQLYNERVY